MANLKDRLSIGQSSIMMTRNRSDTVFTGETTGTKVFTSVGVVEVEEEL